MKIVVIGDSTTVTGFRLAGVKKGYVAEEVEDAKKVLNEVARDSEVSLIILTERLAQELRKEISYLTESRVTPLIVEIPDKFGPIEGKVDPIKELVRKAVGVEIKFE